MYKKVDIIIPTYRPDKKLIKSVTMLTRQSIKPEKIIVVNTDKALWESAGYEKELSKLLKDSSIDFKLIHINKENFDHGRTRNLAVKEVSAPYFVCMTQDAVPYDEYLLENLLYSLNADVKAGYARQIPNEDVCVIESFTRKFNYPEAGRIKELRDKRELGVKLYFLSNVCAVYEKETFDSLGEFDTDLILNEDMLYAYKVINSGKKTAYVAGARVLHSHKYTGREQLSRNFDLGASQSMAKYVFSDLSSEKEGIKMLKKTAAHLVAVKKIYLLPYLIYISACKYIGFFLGKRYKKLPEKLVKSLSSNKGFWERKDV